MDAFKFDSKTRPVLNGLNAFARFVGDVNKDGFVDLALGYPFDDQSVARVYSGRDGTELIAFWGTTPRESLGWSVTGIGDLDQDGHEDLVFGAPGVNTGLLGSLVIASGRTGQLIQRITTPSQRPDGFGWDTCGTADVDNDGIRDLIVSAPSNPPRGTVWVYSGKDRTVLHRLDGQLNSFGYSIDAAGDVDRDGHADILVGGPQDKTAPGYASVMSGKTGKTLYTFGGSQPADVFGFCVAAASDVDLDGYPDVAVGAPMCWSVTCPSTGYVRIFSGKDGSLLRELRGASPGERFGYALTNVGDWNGDGHPDLAVGARSFSVAQGRFPGQVRVFSGKDGSILTVRDGNPNQSGFGSALHAGGDIDGDGLQDLIIAAPGYVAVVYSHSSAVAIGGGCAPRPTVPALRSSAPQLGQVVRFDGTNALPSSFGALLWSRVPDLPGKVGPCAVYLDLARVFPLFFFTADPLGAWTAGAWIPPDRSLLGATLALQAVFAVAPDGEATNGVYLAIRN